MNLLENILGNGQQRQQAQDFSSRFQQGPPTTGYSDQEAQQYYQQVAPQLPPAQYQSAAQQTFERMTPQDREAFARYLHEQAQQQGQSIPGMAPGQYSQYQDSNALAQTTTQLHRQQPGLLGQILGGSSQSAGGGMNPLAKVALGGIAAMAVKDLMGGKL